jgi:hypothetical protein
MVPLHNNPVLDQRYKWLKEEKEITRRVRPIPLKQICKDTTFVVETQLPAFLKPREGCGVFSKT